LYEYNGVGIGPVFLCHYRKELGCDIDNRVELSSICRNEWCRLLESEMDELGSVFHDFTKSGEVHEKFCLSTVLRKMRKGYRNVGPALRVYS